LPRRDHLIKLPLTAVLEQQGKTQVWVLDAATMTVKLQPVQVAGAEGNTVLIGAGLSAGAEVVTAGVHALTPGQKVRRFQTGASAAPASQAASR